MPDVPSLVALLGAYNNLDEPEPAINRREAILGITITLMVISWACVLFRLYTRFRVVYAPGWDDLFVVLSLLASTMNSVGVALATRWGLGKHFILIGVDNIRNFLMTFYVTNATYAMATAFIKISLLLQYMRIFERGSWSRRISIAVAVFTAAWGFAYSMLAWVPCGTPSQYWNNPERKGVTCFGYGSIVPAELAATYVSHTAINMALDMVVLAISVPLYFKRDVPYKTRIALLAVLLMGGLINIIAIWRLVTIVEHKATTYPTLDPTWYGPIGIVLAIVEVDLAVICASIPVFWPVLRSGLLGNIFVTKEVAVTREQRLSSMDDLELQGGHCRVGGANGLGAGSPSKKFYHGPYSQEHIGSLRRDASATVTELWAGSKGRKKSLFRRG